MQINRMIADMQDMAAKDEEKAITMRNNLFTLLLKRDKFYIIPDIKEGEKPSLFCRPLISPASDEDPHLFLRIFSDESLAAGFGKALPLTSVELVQLIKYWFLRGVSGVLLNDGDAWVTIPIPVLSDLFCDIVGKQPSDPMYVEVVELSNDIRVNSFSHLMRKDTGNTILFSHESDIEGDAIPATIKHLFSVDRPVITPSGRQIPKEIFEAVMEEIGGGDDVLR